MGAPSRTFAVQVTPELRRVLALPRRTWTEEEARHLARGLTALLKTPEGTQELRPIQAVALMEGTTEGGLFAPIVAGGGKTLITALAPVVYGATRPLLLLPAKLVDKTEREFRALAQHWKIANFIRIESYEKLGRVEGAEILDRFQPDMVLADEAHRLKNKDAAVTKRVMRWLLEHPAVPFLPMSGTFSDRSLREFSHLLRRALREPPCPRSASEIDEWALAIDELKSDDRAMSVGALELLRGPEEAAEVDEVVACRRAFRRRLVETPGVVATAEGLLSCSLSISAISPPLAPAVKEAMRKLKEDWELPDGTKLADGLAVYRHMRELALDFFYRWDPMPPRVWREHRKEWASACRDILTNNRRDLDSELQVIRFLDDVVRREAQGTLRAPMYARGIEALRAWRAVKDSHRLRTVAVWLDDTALKAARAWGESSRSGRAGGIIWTEHTAFAERLAADTGWAFFGEQGRDARGRAIEDAAGSRDPIIASIASNGEGRNLQAWCKGLVVSPPALGSRWEQLLARKHRPGQKADEVTFDVMLRCPEHVQAMNQARADARYVEQAMGQQQRLCYADIDLPTDWR
jgi:hypothetical protein